MRARNLSQFPGFGLALVAAAEAYAPTSASAAEPSIGYDIRRLYFPGFSHTGALLRPKGSLLSTQGRLVGPSLFPPLVAFGTSKLRLIGSRAPNCSWLTQRRTRRRPSTHLQGYHRVPAGCAVIRILRRSQGYHVGLSRHAVSSESEQRSNALS